MLAEGSQEAGHGLWLLALRAARGYNKCVDASSRQHQAPDYQHQEGSSSARLNRKHVPYMLYPARI